MRVKELNKTVNVAWSPETVSPIYLAAGTAAQQLDSSLGTNSVLELYDINLSNTGHDMIIKGSQVSTKRFHKIIWSPTGTTTNSKGLIVGGCDNGSLHIYSALKLLNGEESLVVHQEKHTGPIKSLDFNPFQNNLIASGASESEIFIWDLKNTTTPMTPGTKTQPYEDVQSVSWNKQVQHILASVFASRCVIWDLRKNEPIIKLSDTQSRVRWHAMQWNPEVATQLWLASEEDQAPVIQLWDLRYSSAPTKSLQIHSRGVLSLSYCPKDPEMMVSCGKDFKMLCWNPKSETQSDEILSEITTSNQWYSDISWCPKNPALIAGTSLDGVVSLYSLFGADKDDQQNRDNMKLADSFPGMDPLVKPPIQQQQSIDNNDLKKPPKWLRKPIGATFAFGGRLISFSNSTPNQVSITQVITEPELVEQTLLFDTVIKQNNLIDYCIQRADQQENSDNRLMWYFLKSNFVENPRSELLNLLGYDINDMKTKYNAMIKPDQMDEFTNDMNNININPEHNNEIFDSIAANYKINSVKESAKKKIISLQSNDDIENKITEAILTGNLEAAVDLCLDNGYPTEAIIIANNSGADLLKKAQNRFFLEKQNNITNLVNSLIENEWNSVVENCPIKSWKQALVAVLTHSSNNYHELCEKLGKRLLDESVKDSSMLSSAILCYICAGNVEQLIDAWQLKQHKDLTKQSVEELHNLAEIIVLLQKGNMLHGRTTELNIQSCNLLINFANHLINQGQLHYALNYLNDANNEKLNELKDRIYFAIGQKTLQQQQQSVLPNHHQGFIQQQRNQRSNSTSSGYGNLPYTSMNQGYNTQQWGGGQSQYQAPGLPPPSIPTPQTIPSSVPMSSNEILTQPPRPPSSSGTIGSGTSLHRNKYVLDPSVRSNQPTNNLYGSMSYNNQQQSISTQQVPFYPTPTSNASLYNTPTVPNTFTPMQPTLNHPSMPPMNNTYDYNYSNNMQPQSYSEPPPPPALMAREKNPTPPPGWNDPPTIRSRSRTTSQSQDVNHNQPPPPITHPIFGTQEINQNIPAPTPMTNIYGQQAMGHAQPPPFNPMPVGGDNQMNPWSYDNTNTGGMNNMYPMDKSANYLPQGQWSANQNPMNTQNTTMTSNLPPKVEPVEIVKKPIPSEYVHIQETLDELRTKCTQMANNAPTRRKLDDVGKRLEHLYDMLRDSKLTPNTLQSLNELVKLVTMGDYANSIALHTEMISGSDFSQIASFMPGIKILLQTAMQLNVYLK